MPVTNDSLNKKLYQLLKTQGFDPIPKDSKGDTTPVPDEAEVFKFTFKKNNEPVGPAWVTVDGNSTLKVYYDDKVMHSMDEDEGFTEVNSFTDFLKQLKMWAQRRQLGFDTENQDHLASDMAQRDYMKKKEQIKEGYYPMGKSASYNDSVPTVKIILQHTRQIQEGEQRFRNISKIFLENTQGERILAPTNRPGIAQIYARHLAEGGLPHDENWKHITSLVEEYTKMAGFVRATKGNQFNESAQKLINEGINHYINLRETLGKMRGHKGYNAYFESFTPMLNEDECDEEVSEMFVQEKVDPRIQDVMNVLSRLKKKAGIANEELNEISDAEKAKIKMQTPAYKRLRAAIRNKEGGPGEPAGGKNWMVSPQDLSDIEKGKLTTPAGRKQRALDLGFDDELSENLGPEQKKVKQLGPTEKITKDNPVRGKLVGADESVESTEESIIEGQDELAAIKRLLGK